MFHLLILYYKFSSNTNDVPVCFQFFREFECIQGIVIQMLLISVYKKKNLIFYHFDNN